MVPTIPHFSSHAEAEWFAMQAALALERIGTLMAGIRDRLPSMVIFDPEAPVAQDTLLEGLAFGAQLCAYLSDQGKRLGFQPEDDPARWHELVQAVVAHRALELKGPHEGGPSHEE